MIKIFKNKDIKIVTNGVYKSLYEPLGYKPFVPEKKKIIVAQKPTTDVKNEESSLSKKKRGE